MENDDNRAHANEQKHKRMPIILDADPWNANWLGIMEQERQQAEAKPPTLPPWPLPAKTPASLRLYLRERGMTVEKFKQSALFERYARVLPWLHEL